MNSPHDQNKIRNFSIIAHIDHGKSTLADRMLEVTDTVDERLMRDQVLDKMDLEQERGITIKMQPAKMLHKTDDQEYILNLIDTPGHIDFSYEVSRALKAVEGSLLLVDSTQGVQAQTLTTLAMAREIGLVIIPVVTKVDSPLARVDDIKLELAELLDCDPDTILEVSGKTGEGVPALLDEIVKKIPAPTVADTGGKLQGLIFDFQYSSHRGIIVYIRVFGGQVQKGDELGFVVAGERFIAGEVGVFSPDEVPVDSLQAGEIGYIVTGIKQPGIASAGDTITGWKPDKKAVGLEGYESPRPVVWASVYPESQDDFDLLRQALQRLKLTDSALSFEEETSGSLGRGFRCGLLGMLHLEIVIERLRREGGLELTVTSPSITYEIEYKDGKTEMVYTPIKFPDHGTYMSVNEPWIEIHIIGPTEILGDLMPFLYEHEAELKDTKSFGDGRSELIANMPLRELMRNFFDELKSISSGYASLSYEPIGMRPAEVTRMDVLIAEEPQAAFTKVIATRRAEEESGLIVEKLYKIMPRQQFVTKIQAKVGGKIISSRTLSALRKDVTAKLYGGDFSRKKKLLEKQKKGKKKALAHGRGSVNIPHDVFMKVMRGGD